MANYSLTDHRRYCLGRSSAAGVPCLLGTSLSVARNMQCVDLLPAKVHIGKETGEAEREWNKRPWISDECAGHASFAGANITAVAWTKQPIATNR